MKGWYIDRKGDGMKEIIQCIDKETNQKPRTIQDEGVERIINRKIIEWQLALGSYGMGGPGFFGMLLEKTEKFNQEWLVLTLWAASEWLLMNKQWVHASSIFHHIQKPLFSGHILKQYDPSSGKEFPEQEGWDNFSELIIDGVISDATIDKNHAMIKISLDDRINIIEIPKDKSLLPVWGGDKKAKTLDNDSNLADAWVFTGSGNLIVTQ